MASIRIIKCGTVVVTNVGKISGIISALEIRFEKITYQIRYFDSGDFKDVWLLEHEFETQEEMPTAKIGYK